MKNSLFKVASVCCLAMMALWTSNLSAQDGCANALPINLGDLVTGTTVGASVFDGPICVTAASTGGAHWYEFVGTGDQIIVTTCEVQSNFDTKLFVYTGACGAYTCVTGNDDSACGFSGLRSTVQFASVLGTTYYIAVSGFGAGEGSYGMSLNAVFPGCTDPSACNFDSGATVDDGSCDFSCLGCTDPLANNFDPDATVDDGSCITCAAGELYTTLVVGGGGFPGEVGWNITDGAGVVIASGGAPAEVNLCLPTDQCYAFNMTDSFGDGWNGNTYSFTGDFVASGDLDTAAEGDGESVGTDILSLGTGCVIGCTDPLACNFDATADFNAGCDFVSCGGCTDPLATNFDPTATFDDGSCVFCNAGEILLFIDMTDTFGDGWNGANYALTSTGGALIASGDLDTAADGDGVSVGLDGACVAPGCYLFTVNGGTFPGEIGWSLSDQLGNFYGEGVSPNGPVANFPVDFGFTGSCDFEGCTDPVALNYVPSATIDDGSCILPPANNDVCNAEAVTCGLSVAGTTNLSSDNEGLIGTTCGGDAVTSPGVWYVFNAAADQQVIASTCASLGGDTKIHVYLAAPDCDNLVCIGSNDDGCGAGSFLSSIAFTAQTGNDYYILVSEFGTGVGVDFTLDITCQSCDNVPTNDDCANALPQVNGITFTGTTCCTNPSDAPNFAAGFGTAYDQFFVFNSGDFDTFFFDVVNISGGNVGIMIYDGACGTLVDIAGCLVTGQCAGDVSDFLTLTPNTDYYFAVFTTEPNTCGEFEFTTTGVVFGCTDPAANNFDPLATDNDGTCDYTGVVNPNDDCASAIVLNCGDVVNGSTGGSTANDFPAGLDCSAGAGTGVWHTFVGTGDLVTLSTCGSVIDAQIGVWSAADCNGPFACVNSVEGGSMSEGFSAGGGGCVDPGCDVDTNSAAYTNTIAADPFCCNTAWDGICQGAYEAAGGLPNPDPNCGAGNGGDCDFFNADDTFGVFIADAGTTYYIYVGSETTEGEYTLDISCEPVIEGCTNPAAYNYLDTANVDDGSCDFFSQTCDATPTGTPFILNLADSFGDGWDAETTYEITDGAGNVIVTGSLNTADYSEDNDNFLGADFGFDLICLEDGCYTITVAGGIFVAETSFSLVDELGTEFAAGAGATSVSFTVGAAVCGCTDPGACNFDPAATDEDGSCEFITCAGCTDAGACNFDADATIDDGSCCFENCLTVQMNDSFGDGWNGNTYEIYTIDDVLVATGDLDNAQSGDGSSTGTDILCLADGCYYITVGGGTFLAEVSWSLFGTNNGVVSGGAPVTAEDQVTFSMGAGACVVGCVEPVACNYDPNANIADCAACDYDCPGCTYDTATNWDPAAGIDDGTCMFEIANPCPADINGDLIVNTADLLLFLTAFGTECL